MNKKILIIIFIIALLIIGSIIFLRSSITGDVVYPYTYTTAICNNSNFCQDYEITCAGDKLTNSRPITGAVIQHNNEWKDPRNKTALCS